MLFIFWIAMNNRLRNLLTVLKSPCALIVGWTFALAIGVIIEYFSDRNFIRGNMGMVYAIVNLIFDIINIILIGIFFAAVIWKWKHFSSQDTKTTAFWRIGSFFSVLVTWCPSCTLTIATYLWLGSILVLLPYSGLEIKILWTLLLSRSLYDTIKTLTICKR